MLLVVSWCLIACCVVLRLSFCVGDRCVLSVAGRFDFVVVGWLVVVCSWLVGCTLSVVVY